MSKLSSSTTLSEVTFIERRGMGRIYRATITIEDLCQRARAAGVDGSGRSGVDFTI